MYKDLLTNKRDNGEPSTKLTFISISFSLVEATQ